MTFACQLAMARDAEHAELLSCNIQSAWRKTKIKPVHRVYEHLFIYIHPSTTHLQFLLASAEDYLLHELQW